MAATFGSSSNISTDGVLTITLSVAVPVAAALQAELLTAPERVAVFQLLHDTVASAKEAYLQSCAIALKHLSEPEIQDAVARAGVLREEPAEGLAASAEPK